MSPPSKHHPASTRDLATMKGARAPTLITRATPRYFDAEMRIVPGVARQPLGLAFGRQLDCLLEQVLEPVPLRRRHAPSSCSFSHARAIAHWRLTVAGDTPVASAVSSTVRPPK